MISKKKQAEWFERQALALYRKAQACPSGVLILEEMAELTGMLLDKNRMYGDSALSPLRLFSSADPEEQLRVRIDDKLSRVSQGLLDTEDVERDLLGYLVLLRAARSRKAASAPDLLYPSQDLSMQELPVQEGPTAREEGPSLEEEGFEPKERLVADFPCQVCGEAFPDQGKAVCDACFKAKGHGQTGANNGKISERTSEVVLHRR